MMALKAKTNSLALVHNETGENSVFHKDVALTVSSRG